MCWAVPVRGGYVLRADQAAHAAVQSADGRRPQFVDWAVAIVHPGSSGFAAERVRRPTVLAIESAMRRGAQTRPEPTGRLARLHRSWTSLALGAALLVLSGTHWVLALAGAWLLAGRPWMAALLGIGPSDSPATAWTAADVQVTAAPHAGLGQVGEALEHAPDDAGGYGQALAAAQTLGLDEAAEVYSALIKHPNPMALPVEVGMWTPAASVEDRALGGALPDVAEAPDPPGEGADAVADTEPGDEASDDPMNRLP
ncbi:MAG: hypothetical protein OXG43_01155 [Chloroflexi bacterium]|nr:hypothetical protein [Chloroflexota bacterium]